MRFPRPDLKTNDHDASSANHVMKGLAKPGNCLRHDLPVKYVDVSL
jgi:hypothetical protein